MDRRKLEPPTTSQSSPSSSAIALPKPFSERDRLIGTQKRWNCREENEFLRVLTGYGVDLLAGSGSGVHPQPDWSRFKAMAKLDKKSDDALSDYYKVFIAMCKRRAGVRLADDERELDGICEDISEDHARLILDRLELLSKLRELSKSGRLDDRLHLCQNNFDTPDWWESGRHDRELIRAVLKHGLYRSDYHVFNDPTYTFGASQRMFVEEVESHLLKAHLAEIEQLALLDHELALKREQSEAAEMAAAKAKKMAVAAAEAEAIKVSADAAAANAVDSVVEALVVKKEEALDADEVSAVKTEKTEASPVVGESLVIEDSDTETAAAAVVATEPMIKKETTEASESAEEKSTDDAEKLADESLALPKTEDTPEVDNAETAAEKLVVVNSEADQVDAEKTETSDETAKPETTTTEDKPTEECTDAAKSVDKPTESTTAEQTDETADKTAELESTTVEDVDMDKSVEKTDTVDEPTDEVIASPAKSPAVEDPKSPAKTSMEVDEDETAVEKSPAKEMSSEEIVEPSTPEKPKAETETEMITETTTNDTVVIDADTKEDTAAITVKPTSDATEVASAVADDATAVSSGGGDPDDDEVMKEKEKAVEEECKKQAADLKARFPDLEVTQPSRPFVKPIVDIKAIKGRC